MGVKPISENSGGNTDDYELPKEEGFPARCIGVIGLGTHPNTHEDAKPGQMKEEVMIIWELSELMEDGKPFCINWRGTHSMGKNANLTKILVAWRNRDFTAVEKESFSLPTILGAPSLLTVKHKGKWANVGSIAPLPKAMAAGLIDQVNPTVNFGAHELGENKDFDNIWPWVKDIIARSEEGKAYKINHPNFFDRAPRADENQGSNVGAQGPVDTPIDDDDIPF